MINPATYITLSTVRLVSQRGDVTSVGTGFFYIYEISIFENGQEKKIEIATIVTNKHVVKDMETLTITLSLCPKDAVLTDTAIGPNDFHQFFRVDNLQERLIYHPDSEVDVCIYPIAPILDQVSQVSPAAKIRHTFLHKNFRLPDSEQAFIRPIESIVMIGYPNGLWDAVNNRPIARRGLTASHPLQAWNGKRQFVIDAACFPGSSGSPVFLFEDGMFRNGEGYSPGTRARLLGILFAGPLISQKGRLEERFIPTSTTLIPVVEGVMNLGYVAHIDTLDDLIPVLRQIIERELATNSVSQ